MKCWFCQKDAEAKVETMVWIGCAEHPMWVYFCSECWSDNTVKDEIREW